MPSTTRSFCFSLFAICVVNFFPASVQAQEEKRAPLHLEGFQLNGLHTFVTDNWVTAEVTVVNPNPVGHDCRVVLFYASQPDVQYARDVWVPGRSSLSTCLPVGPAPVSKPGLDKRKTALTRSTKPQELQALIYDRTGDRERLVLPKSEERVRSRLVNYQPRETVTCVLRDEKKPEDPRPPRYPVEAPEPEDVIDLVWAFRAGAGLSEHVRLIDDSLLPPMEEAYDGVDHLVLAGRRLSLDPPGQVALSRWLRQGGRLWVMLDLADESLVGQILGEAPGFEVIGHTTLTRVLIESTRVKDVDREVREFERPIDFVRVNVGPDYTVLHLVNGWPASFIRTVGKGRVLVTTLGAGAWFRPRNEDDSRSPFENIPDVPVVLPPMEFLTTLLQLPQAAGSDSAANDSNVFEPLLNQEIGYRVVGVGTAGMVFGGFLLMVLVLGVGLRRWGRSELLGWLGPVAAVFTGGAFVVLGEASRRAVPPTLAVAEFVVVQPQASEQSASGILGLLQPDGGPIHLGSQEGGILNLDMAGLEGQTRRLVTTDLDHWHWEQLALPAGVRFGSFLCTVPSEKPLSCIASFGPRGLEGKISSGRFQGLGDALIQAPSQRCFAVRLQPDGGFAVTEGELLPPGQYVAETVLSDRQQTRQRIYQRLLESPSSLLSSSHRSGARGDNRCMLVAWADPVQVPFNLEADHRWAGSALLNFPVEFERTPPGRTVTVPRAFVSYRRILETGPSLPTLEGTSAIEQHLRFQLPPSVLPLKVERARLLAKVDTPSRRFTVIGQAKTKRAILGSVDSPVDPVQIDIVGSDVPALDDQGGLHLDVEVSGAATMENEQPTKWVIQSLELEITGQTMERK
jgi:hypothetical protein